MIFIRRQYRITYWLNENTKQFDQKADNAIIDKFNNQVTRLLSDLRTRLKLCGAECQQLNGCKYYCLLPRFHENDGLKNHNCYGSHKCEEMCEYCEEEAKEAKAAQVGKDVQTPRSPEPGSTNDGEAESTSFAFAKTTVEPCGYPAGHGGKHDCNLDVKDHSCGKPCSLSKYGNCKRKCSKTAGHEVNWEDDICLCDSDVHYCNEPCDAPKCDHLCIVRHDKQHTLHDCGGRTCLFSCEVVCSTPMNPAESKECGQPCACDNHFHQLNIIKRKETENQEKGREQETNESRNQNGMENRENKHNNGENVNGGDQEIDFHCCMKVHYCGVKCQEDGICTVDHRRIPETREYISKSGEKFKYEAWTTTANARRKCCAVIIPEGKKKHDGVHLCYLNDSQKQIHTCDVRCPSCDYFCDLEFNHQGLHRIINHGNMVNTIFVSEKDAFNVVHPNLYNRNKNSKSKPKSKSNNLTVGLIELKDDTASVCSTSSAADHESGIAGISISSIEGYSSKNLNANTFGIDLKRSYVRDDRGDAEMCHNFCVSMGRGHVHTILCENHPNATTYDEIKQPESCERQYDNKPWKRHAPKDKYGVNSNNIDEVTHDKFWELLGFEDPVKHPQIRKEFEKCKHYCDAKEHKPLVKQNSEEDDDWKQYCQLDVWHEPAKDKNNPNQTITEGHLFNCSHQESPHMYVNSFALTSG